MRIAICDDDNIFTNHLNELILFYFQKKKYTLPTIDIFQSGDALLSIRNEYDIVFLDVEMPGCDGISVGKAIKSATPKCIIIMITSFAEYLDDAMRFNVFRYISKPLDTRRLYRNLDDAISAYTSIQDTTIAFECNGETIACNTSSILYIETLDKKINIVTMTKSYSFYGTIAYFENDLPHCSFYRSHRSYIVNLAHVTEFTHDKIILDSNHSVYLSKRKYSDFKKHWLQYLGSTK